VASGSGGPAIFLARLCGCRVTGVDINAHGVEVATHRAQVEGLGGRVAFQQADGDAVLPFPDRTFDAIVCIDSANHFPHRLQDWHRVLKPGGVALFTDPVVITGLVSNEELATRSSIGYFLFSMPAVNERLIEQAGLELARNEDATENAALVSKRWHDARAEDRDALIRIEGEDRFAGLQKFFWVVYQLTSERRVSRFVYFARKPALPA